MLCLGIKTTEHQDEGRRKDNICYGEANHLHFDLISTRGDLSFCGVFSGEVVRQLKAHCSPEACYKVFIQHWCWAWVHV